jgi:hypothetical protein
MYRHHQPKSSLDLAVEAESIDDVLRLLRQPGLISEAEKQKVLTSVVRNLKKNAAWLDVMGALLSRADFQLDREIASGYRPLDYFLCFARLNDVPRDRFIRGCDLLWSKISLLSPDQRKAILNQKNAGGGPSFMEILTSGPVYDELLCKMIDAGADVNALTSYGTPLLLCLATSTAHIESFKKVLHHPETNLHVMDREGKNIVHQVGFNIMNREAFIPLFERLNKLNYLSRHGLMNQNNFEGRSPLKSALSSHNYVAVIHLVGNGADVKDKYVAKVSRHLDDGSQLQWEGVRVIDNIALVKGFFLQGAFSTQIWHDKIQHMELSLTARELVSTKHLPRLIARVGGFDYLCRFLNIESNSQQAKEIYTASTIWQLDETHEKRQYLQSALWSECSDSIAKALSTGSNHIDAYTMENDRVLNVRVRIHQ